MDGNPLLQWLGRWLTPESLPAWVAALAATAGCVYMWYRGKVRASKIVLCEANRTLFSKLPEAERRLSMAFNGQEIESLAMMNLVVWNEGPGTIEDIEFTIEANKEARILAIQLQHSPPGVAMSWRGPESERNRWTVDIAYLNPLSLAEEQVRLALFCEPEPEAIQAQGGGKGWSLEFLDRAELKARKGRRLFMVVPVLILLTLAFFACFAAIIAWLDSSTPDWRQQWWGALVGLALMFGGVLGLFSVVAEAYRRLMPHYPD